MNQLWSTPERRLLLALLATRLPFALFIHGTEDVTGWAAIGRAVAVGQNPYATGYVNWPPLWPMFAAAAHGIAEATPLGFAFLVKLAPIAADVVIAFLLFARAGSRIAYAYAFNPIAIYVTSIHGQFDSLPALCILIALIHVSERGGAAWLAVGTLFKTWPLFLLPAFVARTRARFTIAAIVIVPLVAIMGAIYLANPSVIQERVLSYRGFPAWWGVGTFLDETEHVRIIFYIAMTAVALFVLAAGPPVARGALLLALTFTVFTPGFGLQYLLWVVPIGLLVDPKRAIIYSIVAGIAIAFETLFRPFNGHIGDVVRVLPHSGFARDYGGERDHFWTLMDRLPVWLFAVYWWLSILLSAKRKRDFNADTPVRIPPLC